MEDDEFFDCLTNIVMAGTPEALTWMSESDIPLEVVRLPDSEVFHWVPEILNLEECFSFSPPSSTLLREGIVTDNKSYVELYKAFNFVGEMGRVFRRTEDKDKPYEISLYLLARFCGTWVGVKATLIQT